MDRELENGFHVLNNRVVALPLKTARQNAVQDILSEILLKTGLSPIITRTIPGQRLIPVVVITVDRTAILINVTIPFVNLANLNAAHERMVTEYQSLGEVLPLVVGSLGSWNPRNEDIRSLLNIDGRSWSSFHRKCRTAAIRGSMEIIRRHLDFHEPQPVQEIVDPFE